MALSQTALQGVLSEATSAVFLETLTITHSDFDTLRLVNNYQELVRNEDTFSPFPFRVRGSQNDGQSPPSLRINADIVDQRIIEALRTAAGKREKPIIKYEIVLAGSPDTVEFGPMEFQFGAVSTDGLATATITATFLPGALNDAFPSLQFAPSNASE